MLIKFDGSPNSKQIVNEALELKKLDISFFETNLYMTRNYEPSQSFILIVFLTLK